MRFFKLFYFKSTLLYMNVLRSFKKSSYNDLPKSVSFLIDLFSFESWSTDISFSVDFLKNIIDTNNENNIKAKINY